MPGDVFRFFRCEERNRGSDIFDGRRAADRKTSVADAPCLFAVEIDNALSLLPEVRERKRVASRAVQQTTSGSMLAGLTVAASLVMYVSGYARMTGVNYQRVKIKREISLLQTQHELLATQLIQRGSKEAVETWALGNKMAPPSVPAVVLRATQLAAR